MNGIPEVVGLRHLPRLAALLPEKVVDRRRDEFGRTHPALLWQLERDLTLLYRYVDGKDIARAYQDLLRNPGKLDEALYEIRVAAMLASVADRIELAPAIGQGKCDARCRVDGHEIFFEVATVEDIFPFTREEWRAGRDAPMRGRVTVEASFDPTSAGSDPEVEGTPKSKDLRDKIAHEARQLPTNALNVVVVGTPGGRSLHTADALYGDPRTRITAGRVVHERFQNGLFSVPDDVGGTSGLSAVVWMKLARHFADVRVHSRLFVNPLAATPMPPDAEAALRFLFDRRAVLEREVERIRTVLIERYQPERIILFGSLADERLNKVDRVHEWSDLDLFIVKSTTLPFYRRAGEVCDLVEPLVATNVVVYTSEELERAQQEGQFFIRDEILAQGEVLFP